MSSHTSEEELDMMRDPNRWPHTTMLPLIKRTKGAWPETGFLYQPSMQVNCPSPEPVVYLGNMFEGARPADREKVTYASFEAIIADGWEVD